MSARKPFASKDYWESRLQEHPDIHGVGYLGLGRAFNSWMYRVRRHVFDRTVRTWVPDLPTASVLDLGSGVGFYLERWLALGAGSVHAVDLTESAVALLLRDFPRVRSHVGDISDWNQLRAIPLEPEQFDVISCMDVLFHVVDDDLYDAAIDNIARMLHPGGHFIFSDNCLHSSEIRLPHHVSRTLDNISAVLARHGFQVVSRKPMLFLMNAPVEAGPARVETWERWLGRLTRKQWRGWFVGALLYPIERVLVRLRTESPTTEVLVCRKVK
jgi:SAM-dependent methyltransferase